MPKILRTYAFSEFIEDYGEITKIDVAKKIILTRDNMEVKIPESYYQAYINQLRGFEDKYISDKFFILVQEYSGEKNWYIVSRNFIIDNIGFFFYVMFKNTSWTNLIKCYNTSRIVLPQENTEDIVIDKWRILSLEVIDRERGKYIIHTHKSDFYGKYKSSSFIGALGCILQMSLTEREKSLYQFIIYPDGAFERKFLKEFT